MATDTKSKKKTKARKKVREGKVFIQSSYNNTIVTVTDMGGNVLVSSSAGRVGFQGARKATPFAAQKVIASVIEQLQAIGFEEARVYVKGIGTAREAAVRSLSGAGLILTSIRDVTPIPHNGVRAKKRRRV